MSSMTSHPLADVFLQSVVAPGFRFGMQGQSSPKTKATKSAIRKMIVNFIVGELGKQMQQVTNVGEVEGNWG